MYFRCRLVAICCIFISFTFRGNQANNDIKKIYVPSAPINLTATNISSTEVYLSWGLPLTFTVHNKRPPIQSDEPKIPDPPTNTTTIPPKDEEKKNWFREDSKSDYSILNDRKRRELDTRWRRDSSDLTEEKIEHYTIERMKAYDMKKKSGQWDLKQTAYCLYYEQGNMLVNTLPVTNVYNSTELMSKSVYPSTLGMEDNESPSIKNLTLLNKAGILTKVVGYRLKNLKPFTPYKIWVRAFQNFDGMKFPEVLERLGPPSQTLYVLTDVLPPTEPVVLNLTCDQKNDEISLQWRQPQYYNNTLDQYVVTIRKMPEKFVRTKMTLPTNRNDIETTINVKVDLQTEASYEVRISAMTVSVSQPKILREGPESPPQEISSDQCLILPEAMTPDGRGGMEKSPNTVALIATIPILLLVLVVIPALYWRCRSRLSKCISAAYNYLEEGGERGAHAPLNAYKKSAVAICPPPSIRPPRMLSSLRPPRTPDLFVQHVNALHKDGDNGFSKEYEIVVSSSAALAHTSHYSHRPENRLKNRYLNITAYDHSRVCVSLGGRCGAAGCCGSMDVRSPSCDYVNANFIDGMLPHLDRQRIDYIKKKIQRRNRPERQAPKIEPKASPMLAEGIESAFLNIEFSGIVESELDGSDQSDCEEPLDDVYVDIDGVPTPVKLEWLVWKRRYIATQGPTPATLEHFWLMLHQHKVSTIVMITNLVERGRRKCDMYWPSGSRGSTASFGPITVTLQHEDVRAAYTVRHLLVSCSDGSTPRSIVQFHYTVWPDHGTPRHPLALLPFVHAAREDQGTVLVHCSAGVGRTGTYIVLDAQLNQLKLTGTLSPLGFLCRARTQRNHLVQTEEQYVFVHDALLEHVRSGVTSIEITKMRDYLVQLFQPVTPEELSMLETSAKSSETNLDLNETASVKSAVNETNSVKSATNESNSVKSATNESNSVKSATNESNSVKSATNESNSVKSQVNETSSDKSVVNGSVINSEVNEMNGLGEEIEGVYDLATKTDTYSKKIAQYNSLSEQEKEEIRKANRVENYAILERMRSLSNKSQQNQGPPPVNLLEKQFQLICRSCVEPSVCSRAPHNLSKNRVGAALPSDVNRVMLVPKPGQEGSEYVNASWVCGRVKAREYAVSEHPSERYSSEIWRLMWDHTAQLALVLSAEDEDCEIFWPTEEEKEVYVANYKATFVSKEIYVAYRKSERKPEEKAESVTNLKRQESDCADDDLLIPENGSSDSESVYKFDRTELRLDRLSTNSNRKSLVNGDCHDNKPSPKSPKSPSKMSFKSLKLNSPTFKFPDWSRAGAPPDMPPPPPPNNINIPPEKEAELRRPCYYYQKVDTIPTDIPKDRIIQVYNVGIHSLQDDYQLNVKFLQCDQWLEGESTAYTVNKPEENELINEIKMADSDTEIKRAIDKMVEPYKDSFALIEFVSGLQTEYKNGPVVVVDKYGGEKAISFCTLSTACGGARSPSADDPLSSFRPPSDSEADLYCAMALVANARSTHKGVYTLQGLLKGYAAIAAYGDRLNELR